MKSRFIFVLYVVCVILVPSLKTLAQPIDPTTQYNQALQAYAEKNYTEAEKLFADLLKRDPDNGRLQYNLGNVYLTTGKLGEAIQYYRKAILIQPRMKELRANLDLALSKVGIVKQSSLRGYLAETFYFWITWVTVNELRSFFMILSLFFWGVFFWVVLRKKRFFTLRNILLILVFFYFAGGVILKTRISQPARFAVVLEPTVDVRASFVDENPIFQIQEGHEVQVLESHVIDQNNQKKTWVKIMAPNGQKGWVQDAQVGVI